MYAIKQAMLLSGSLPFAEITIYYMDIRAFGKGYEEFYRSAQVMGIEFIKAKVARLTENADQSVTLRVERIDQYGQVEEHAHDLVVLSLGLTPAEDLQPRFLSADRHRRLRRGALSEGCTVSHGCRGRIRGRYRDRPQGHRRHDSRSGRGGNRSLAVPSQDGALR